MNRAHLHQRLEIAFWTVIVSLLTNRKVVQRIGTGLGVILLFGLLTMGLYLLGQAVVQWTQADFAVDASEHTVSHPLFGSDAQMNLLLVLSDDLTEARPRLEGLWMIIYQGSLSRLIFLPILPSTDAHGEMERLQSMFTVQGDGRLAIDFIEAVRVKNIRLDGYVLIDRVAISELLQSGGAASPSSLEFSSMPEVEALLAQTKMLNTLCISAKSWARHTSLLEERGRQVHFILVVQDERSFPPPLNKLSADWACEVPGLSEAAFAP